MWESAAANMITITGKVTWTSAVTTANSVNMNCTGAPISPALSSIEFKNPLLPSTTIQEYVRTTSPRNSGVTAITKMTDLSATFLACTSAYASGYPTMSVNSAVRKQIQTVSRNTRA